MEVNSSGRQPTLNLVSYKQQCSLAALVVFSTWVCDRRGTARVLSLKVSSRRSVVGVATGLRAGSCSGSGSGLFIIQMVHRGYSISTMEYRISPCLTPL
jgi:hypothetical protein